MCVDDNGDYDDDGKEPKCEVSNHVGDPRCKLATVARFTNLPVKDDHHDDDDDDPDDDDLRVWEFAVGVVKDGVQRAVPT